ncbi:hypothetical protein FB107DRAFT_267791 [Schizophyllum commune]
MFWGSRRIEAARPSVSTLQQAPYAPAFCRAYPSAGLTAAERAAALDPGVVASQCDSLTDSAWNSSSVLRDGGDRGWPFCSGASAVRMTLTIYHLQDLCISFVAVRLHLQGHGEVCIDKRTPYIYDSMQYIDKANPIASLLGYVYQSDFAEMEAQTFVSSREAEASRVLAKRLRSLACPPYARHDSAALKAHWSCAVLHGSSALQHGSCDSLHGPNALKRGSDALLHA